MSDEFSSARRVIMPAKAGIQHAAIHLNRSARSMLVLSFHQEKEK